MSWHSWSKVVRKIEIIMPLHRPQFHQELIAHKQLCSVLLIIIFCDLFVKSATRVHYDDVAVSIPQCQRYSDSRFASADSPTRTLIYPQIHDGYTKKVLKTTLNKENGQHIHHILLTYYDKTTLIEINLQLKNDFLPQQHFLGYQNPNSDSNYLVRNFSKIENELCYYQGNLKDRPNTRAAISTCDGIINGIVFIDKSAHIIHAEKKGTSTKQHFLIGTSATDDRNNSEGSQVSKKRNFSNFLTRQKRSTDDVESIYGALKDLKRPLYVELVLVADNGVFKYFNKQMTKVHQFCKDVANILNSLYAPLNIFIILTGVVVWTEKDEIVYDDDSLETLKRFLEYRKKKLSPKYRNDHAQLLTTKEFNNGTIGKAYLKVMCKHEYSGAVCRIHDPVNALVANTMAHEMGHNFGMSHDGPECKCPDKECIMSYKSSPFVVFHWSSCSIDSLNEAFSRGLPYCLSKKPTKTFTPSICGNGFVESGEECDCGPPQFCQSKCCNPENCRLHSNATCGSGECCDLNSCHLKKSGTPCRLANNECDLSEFCTGNSEFCPKDVHKRNLEECDNGAGYCYDGHCGSHDKRCRVIWGNDAYNMESCYMRSSKNGDHISNCGFDYRTDQFIKCLERDAKCGQLQCNFPENRKNAGIQSGATTSIAYAYHKSKVVGCHSAFFNFGMHKINPGLTPNGAKCDEDKICLGQKCVPKAKLRTEGWDSQCPENCNGNGVCNSQGHCHCDIGFSGSSCRLPGPGGSIDSGPATNPNSHDAFQLFLYMFFCGVIPLMLGIFLCISFNRKQAILKRKNIKRIENLPTFDAVCVATISNSLMNIESVKEVQSTNQLQSFGFESIDRLSQTNSESLEASSKSIDTTTLPHVHKSVKNLTKNFEKSLILKSASNYELSTLPDPIAAMPAPSHKIRTLYKSALALKGDRSRSKLKI